MSFIARNRAEALERAIKKYGKRERCRVALSRAG
jgi:hypothetical protein